MAFLIPNGPGDNWPARKLEDGLANPVAYGIVPVFAFANAGVALGGISLATFLQPITLGVGAGLFFGKQIGILGACWLGVKLGIAKLPVRASWMQVYGVSLLCGIGFTISLFIGALAFGNADNQAAAKLGVLTGSLVAGVAGMLVLRQAGANRVKA
jgi:Na+:H+ antiporter, NhaA family